MSQSELRTLLCGAVLLLTTMGYTQTRREDIYSDAVLYQHRTALEKDLKERIIARHFAAPLDRDSEDGYLSACWAIEQYLLDPPEVAQGFNRLFAGYDSIGYDTKRAFLEALYAVEPRRYTDNVRTLLDKETNPHLFALCAVYLYRIDTSTNNANTLKIKMVERFPGYDTIPLLQALETYLGCRAEKRPSLADLFKHTPKTEKKIIFSFQRRDRDYPGMAVVQNADGSWVRDKQGRLQVFEQLARSGPALPFFLTNGNTPQGIFSIQGTDVSKTSMIGPTPNLQLLMPSEGRWEDYFHLQDTAASTSPSTTKSNTAPPTLGSPTSPRSSVSSLANTSASSTAAAPSRPALDSLALYQDLLPPSWRSYTPMQEAWIAGRIGRTEIIAHGTTIDPEYYKNWPFYPLTPTMGCLCAKELWNPTSGHLLVSEQNNLVNAFLSTPGRTGYLIVIDLDDQHKPVSRAEVEALVAGQSR